MEENDPASEHSQCATEYLAEISRLVGLVQEGDLEGLQEIIPHNEHVRVGDNGEIIGYENNRSGILYSNTYDPNLINRISREARNVHESCLTGLAR